MNVFFIRMSLSANDSNDSSEPLLPDIPEGDTSFTTTNSADWNEVNPNVKIPSNWAQKWTREEDQRLLQGIEQHGTSNWKMVSAVVGTRNAGNFNSLYTCR
jgi:hypothetical protein